MNRQRSTLQSQGRTPLQPSNAHQTSRNEMMLVVAILQNPGLMKSVHVSPQDMAHPLARKVFMQKSKMPNADLATLEMSYPYSQEESHTVATWLSHSSSNISNDTMHELCNTIKKNTAKANAMRVLQDAQSVIKAGGDINTAMGMIQKSISTGEQTGYRTMKSIIKDVTSEIKYAKENGVDHLFVPTGMTEFDNKYLGLERGTLTVIAGRPSMGKTAFTMQIAKNIAKTLPTPVHSIEMSNESLAYRMISELTGADSRSIKTGRIAMDDVFNKAAEHLSSLMLFVDDRSRQSLDYISNNTYHLKQQEGKLGALFIDYIGIMEALKGSETAAEKLGLITKGLKKLAKDLNIPVVVLSQLNRGLESRADKRPMNSDLKGSGDIEQDADMIILLHRPFIYDKEASETAAEVIISKARNGPVCTLKMIWDARTTSFQSTFIKGFEDE